MKYDDLTMQEIDRMSAEEVRDLINTNFEKFKQYWDGTAIQDDDLKFYTTPDGFSVVVRGGVEDIEDHEN